MATLRPISLFNTLTRSVDPVVPIAPGEISLYTCGPTVYNFAHIGNLKTYLFQDLLKRTFLAAGYRVRHCMNITDVEDKIIRDSQAEVPAGADNAQRHAAMKALTDRYTAAFLEDLAALGILPPTYTPKATEYIASMIQMVQQLESRGLAYVRDGSVYYRIAGLPQYGRLARLDRDGMKQGVSVDADEYERDSMQDFVLWKAAKPGEPWWDSPWGHGRPGWHIECSAMGIALLGERGANARVERRGVASTADRPIGCREALEGVERAVQIRRFSTPIEGECLVVEGRAGVRGLGERLADAAEECGRSAVIAVGQCTARGLVQGIRRVIATHGSDSVDRRRGRAGPVVLDAQLLRERHGLHGAGVLDQA